MSYPFNYRENAVPDELEFAMAATPKPEDDGEANFATAQFAHSVRVELRRNVRALGTCTSASAANVPFGAKTSRVHRSTTRSVQQSLGTARRSANGRRQHDARASLLLPCEQKPDHSITGVIR